MKKLLALLLTLILAFSLTACGSKDNGNLSQDDSSNGKSSDSNETATITLPSGWDSNPYTHWIDGKWDSSVLPDCVPNEIPGVKADQTTYKDKSQDTLSGNYYIGSVYFADKGYEMWGLSFHCTDDQLDAFLAEMDNNGFYGGQTDDYPYPTYEWFGNGYYAQMHVNTAAMGQEDFNNLAMFDITPADGIKCPTAFSGTKLPDIGMPIYDYGEGIGFGYTAEFEEEVECFWDIYTDKGSLPEYWSFWVDYFGATESQVKDYVQTMVSQGWEITNEDTSNGNYVCSLQKDDIVAGVEVYSEGGYFFKVGFGNMGEMLWY